MHVISSFEHCDFLELAINSLQEKGIIKENIIAIPLETSKDPRKLFDSIHHADGVSLFDLAAVMATIFSVLGASYGFELKWGPIIWGLIGFTFGAIFGFIIDYSLTKKKKKEKTNINTEVVLIIECTEEQLQIVKNILFENMALGVGCLSF